MCKGSVTAKTVVAAAAGISYGIGTTAHGLGALHPNGVSTSDCVACVKQGGVLMLSLIPATLQQQFGIAASEKVTFIETGGDTHDVLLFENGKRGLLVDFADEGIIALCVKASASDPGIIEDSDANDVVTGDGGEETVTEPAISGRVTVDGATLTAPERVLEPA